MGGVDQNMQDTMRYNYVIVLCVWGTRYAVSKLSGGGGLLTIFMHLAVVSYC